MPTDISISGDEVRKLYATGDFSMQQIAEHFGVTRQAILYHLKHKPERDRMRVVVTCDGCGKEFARKRKRGRPGRFFYCESPCKKPAANEELWKLLVEEILE